MYFSSLEKVVSLKPRPFLWQAPVVLAGLQGSGKTAYAVKNFLAPAAAAGRRVLTNVPLSDGTPLHASCEIFSEDTFHFAISDLAALPLTTPSDFDSSLIFFDEAGIHLPAGRNFAISQPFAVLAAICRHRDICLIFAVQSVEQLSRNILDTCAEQFQFTNHSRRLAGGGCLAKISVYSPWQWTQSLYRARGRPPALRSETFKPRKSTFLLYSSALETSHRWRFRPTKTLWLVAGLLCFLGYFPVGIAFGWFSPLRWFSEDSRQPLAADQAIQPPAAKFPEFRGLSYTLPPFASITVFYTSD